MGKLSGCARFFETSKPYFAMVALQFGYAGIKHHYKGIAEPWDESLCACGLPSCLCDGIHFSVCSYIRVEKSAKDHRQGFHAAFRVGCVIDQNFYYAGLKYTSPTFACAISNMTFVMAVIFRMEKLDIKKIRCQAKVIGSAVTVAGAMLMTLYRGPIMEMFWSRSTHTSNTDEAGGTSDRDWLIGSMLVIIATLAWASLFVLQAEAIRTYKNHQLSLATLVCRFGTLQGIFVTFALEHKVFAWKIGWDMNPFTAAYSGIVAFSIAYYVQGIVIKQRGPVFATAFSPLMMIVVAVKGSFILAEKIFLGGESTWRIWTKKVIEDQNVDKIKQDGSKSVSRKESSSPMIQDEESRGEDLQTTAGADDMLHAGSSASLPVSMSAQKFNIKVYQDPRS